MSEESKIGEIDTSGNMSIHEAAAIAVDGATEREPEEDNSTEAPRETQSSSKDEPPRETKSKTSKEVKDEEINWEKADPRYRRAYEAERKRAEDAKKSYDEFRSLGTKKLEEWSQKEKTLKTLEEKARLYERMDHDYRTNPKLKQAIDEIYGRAKSQQVNPVFEQDPLYGWTNEQLNAREQALRAEIEPLKKFYQDQIQRSKEAELNAEVDALNRKAVDEFKSLMGREPTTEEYGRLYTHMTDRKVYDGESAVRGAFFQEIMAAKMQKAMEEQMAKKNIGTRTSTIHPSKSVKNSETLNYRQAALQALEDLDINFN